MKKNNAMKYITTLLYTCISCSLLIAQSHISDKWITPYEKSNHLATPRYAETMRYCRMLEKSSSWIKVTNFGATPQGRELPLVILSKEKSFTPERAAKLHKPIVLVQSGIHAGEIDGKDASLMLMREIAITKKLSHLLDHCTILIMPIFNLDGHERFGRFNRINQNGPREMGWRVTAQNLNLNRDYMKADAPETRAWLQCFNTWKPDMLIDCHVTDGIDFQYDVTYSMEMFENASPSVVAWQKSLENYFRIFVEKHGSTIAPYVFPREEKDLTKGLMQGAATPRFSTGYAAIQNRAALLIETHMLKNYRTRVEATYKLLHAVLEFINQNPNALRDAVKKADQETATMFSKIDSSRTFPLQFKNTDTLSTIHFLGYKNQTVQSDISGRPYTRWTRDTMNMTIPMFDDVIPSVSIKPPLLYLIPPEWKSVIDVLTLHGVKMDRLEKDVDIPVELYEFKNAKWREAPYEGRHPVTFGKELLQENKIFPKGTYVVTLDQPSSKVAIHLLEPDGPDSFVAWGFFDAIFERKEYYETYVMEEIAKGMLKSNDALKKEFETKLSSDSTFAKNPRARLDFFYDRSPFADAQWNVYPVARYNEVISLPTIQTSAKVTKKHE